jgi:hypothetical protein
MLSFIKKLFSSKPAETPMPYKVEAPVVETAKVEEFTFPSTKPALTGKKPAVKKTTVKAKTARKPRAPKA